MSPAISNAPLSSLATRTSSSLLTELRASLERSIRAAAHEGAKNALGDSSPSDSAPAELVSMFESKFRELFDRALDDSLLAATIAIQDTAEPTLIGQSLPSIAEDASDPQASTTEDTTEDEDRKPEAAAVVANLRSKGRAGCLPTRKLISFLESKGFRRENGQRGRHAKYRADSGAFVMVPRHRTLETGTAAKIVKKLGDALGETLSIVGGRIVAHDQSAVA